MEQEQKEEMQRGRDSEKQKEIEKFRNQLEAAQEWKNTKAEKEVQES